MITCKRCGERPAVFCITCQGDLAAYADRGQRDALIETLEALYILRPVLRKTSDEGLGIAAVRGSGISAAVLKARAAIARAKAEAA